MCVRALALQYLSALIKKKRLCNIIQGYDDDDYEYLHDMPCKMAEKTTNTTIKKGIFAINYYNILEKKYIQQQQHHRYRNFIKKEKPQEFRIAKFYIRNYCNRWRMSNAKRMRSCRSRNLKIICLDFKC